MGTELYRFFLQKQTKFEDIFQCLAIDISKAIIPSHKAAASRKKKTGLSERSLPEFSVSLRYVVAVLLYWGRQGRTKVLQCLATDLLGDLLSTLVDDASKLAMEASVLPMGAEQPCPAVQQGRCRHMINTFIVPVIGDTPAKQWVARLQVIFKRASECPSSTSLFISAIEMTVLSMHRKLDKLRGGTDDVSPERVAQCRGRKRKRRLDPELLKLATPAAVGTSDKRLHT